MTESIGTRASAPIGLLAVELDDVEDLEADAVEVAEPRAVKSFMHHPVFT
jgi:hypothetical protein